MSKYYYDAAAGSIKQTSDCRTVLIVPSYNESGVFDRDLREERAQKLITSLEAAGDA